MNKFEILFKLSDTADRLESAGLLREAIVLTNVMKRMADVVELWDDEPDYTIAIQGYEENYIYNKPLARSIYDEYVRDMTDLINIPNNPNKEELKKRLKAFNLQVAKLNSHQTPMQNMKNKSVGVVDASGRVKTVGIENDALATQINNFGLERATDLNDYNRRWQLFMNQMKRARFRESPNAKPIYYWPGMQQYFANLYEQLKLKYIK